MSSRALRMFRQKSAGSSAPGNSAAIPTTAIPSACVRTLIAGLYVASWRVRGSVSSIGIARSKNLASEASRRVVERGVGYGQSDAAKLLCARDDRRPLQQIESDLHDVAAREIGEKGSGHPPVERAHRRAAPDLVVHLPRRDARNGPVAGEPDVPSEDERHLVLRV